MTGDRVDHNPVQPPQSQNVKKVRPPAQPVMKHRRNHIRHDKANDYSQNRKHDSCQQIAKGDLSFQGFLLSVFVQDIHDIAPL